MMWDELIKVFLAKFFPPSKIASLRNQITAFTQRENKSLYEARERLRLFPHHGPQKWMVVHTFYKRATQSVQSMIDAGVGRTLMSKTEEEAYNLIEEMVLNNYQWSNDRGEPKRVGGKYDINALSLLTANLNCLD